MALESVAPIDLLVNNAGVCRLEKIGSISEESVDSQFSLNVKAVINVSQIVTNQMIKHNKPGAIVNISSQSSMRALKEHLVYCATKGALDQITRVLALELAPHKIRVNSVNPTVVWTELGMN
jgi:L-xylulose reductase